MQKALLNISCCLKDPRSKHPHAGNHKVPTKQSARKARVNNQTVHHTRSLKNSLCHKPEYFMDSSYTLGSRFNARAPMSIISAAPHRITIHTNHQVQQPRSIREYRTRVSNTSQSTSITRSNSGGASESTTQQPPPSQNHELFQNLGHWNIVNLVIP